MGTIITGAVLLAAVSAAVYSIVKRKKEGKSSCGCGCSGCAMSGTCHKEK